MPKFRVPIRVSVAPVQTYFREVEIEAENREDAANRVRSRGQYKSENLLQELIDRPGWKPVQGRLEAIRPDRTAYDTYLDEESLDEWIKTGH